MTGISTVRRLVDATIPPKTMVSGGYALDLKGWQVGSIFHWENSDSLVKHEFGFCQF